GPAKPEHRLAAASQRSLQACIASLPLQSSWMSKTYLKSDHFNGGGSPLRSWSRGSMAIVNIPIYRRLSDFLCLASIVISIAKTEPAQPKPAKRVEASISTERQCLHSDHKQNALLSACGERAEAARVEGIAATSALTTGGM